MIAEYENDTLVRKYVYGTGINEPICMIVVSGTTETKYYYYYDGLGSVVALSNNSGSLVETYSYDAFGEVTIRNNNGSVISVSSVANPYMFTGAYYDKETGNYYMRARYYSPKFGRFLSPDPIGYADSMNLYQYCLNNPVNFVDPYGKNAFGGFVSFIAGNGWNNDVDMGMREAGQLGGAFKQGAKDGLEIYQNTATFGLYDNLGWTNASEKVSEYGAAGRASEALAGISRDALIGALTSGATSRVSSKIANSKMLGKGSKLFGRGGSFGNKGVLNNGTVRTGWGWKGSAESGRDAFRTSWSKPGNRTYWNHIDWF